MRKYGMFTSLLLVGSALCAFSAQAIAGAPNASLDFGFTNMYEYEEFGPPASNSPTHTGAGDLCWKSGDDFGYWYSIGSGTGSELDLNYLHFGDVQTPLGLFTYDFNAAYFFLDGNRKGLFSSFADDVIYSHFDLVKTFDADKFSVNIHARTLMAEGTNNVPLQVMERAGVVVNFKPADKWEAQIEAYHGWTIVGHGLNPWSGAVSATYHASDRYSWSLRDVFVHAAGKTPNEVTLNLHINLGTVG